MKSSWTGFHSPLALGIDAFLAHKRALGCLFRVEELSLRLFDRFLIAQPITTLSAITPDVVDAFLVSRPRHAPRSYNHLRGTLVRLFDWLAAHDQFGPSPVRARPRRSTQSRLPFLFDDATARRLLDTASQLPDKGGTVCRGATYRVIFTLLYGLGLRVGEVARLCVGDVDLTRDLLVIRQTKFYKSRLVPFGPRIHMVLSDHLARRARPSETISPSTPVFSLRGGRPVSAGTISQTFHHLVPQLGLSIPDGTVGPRVHDLRHAFAVGTLLRWYRSGLDPSTRLLQLSTFLGHVSPVYHGGVSDHHARAARRSQRAIRAVGSRGRHGDDVVSPSVGALVQAFLADELPVQRGLRPASVKAYRDGLRLFLVFVSRDVSCRLTQISSEAFTLDRVLRFLQDLETTRHNHRRTRNHRLTILRAFFEFLARRCPEYLAVAQQVAAIAVKRAPPPETFFLERDEVETLLRRLPAHGRHALRDRALFLLLYNTGARVQEIADLRIEHLDLGPQPRVRLHGKGDKWRVCPLWSQTVDAITRLLREACSTPPPTRALFTSHGTRALTRFGLYKIVRRHTDPLRVQRAAPIGRHVGPHRLSPHGRRPSARSGRRRQRDPWLARPRQFGDDQSLRGNQHTHEGGGPALVRAADGRLGFIPPNARLAR